MGKHAVCEYVSTLPMRAVLDGPHVWLCINLMDTQIPISSFLDPPDSIDPPSGCDWVQPSLVTSSKVCENTCFVIFCRVEMGAIALTTGAIVPMLSVVNVHDFTQPVGRLLQPNSTADVLADCPHASFPKGMTGYDLIGDHTKGMDHTITRHAIHAEDTHAWVLALTDNEVIVCIGV